MPIELVPPGTHIDFIGKRKLTAAISCALLVAGLVAVLVRGVNLGIDFAGGHEIQLRFAEQVAGGEGAIRSVVTACGVNEPSVVRYGETEASEFLIRFQVDPDSVPPASGDCPLTDTDRQALARAAEIAGGDAEAGGGADEMADRLTAALGNALGELEVQRIEFVGPRVGAELREDGVSSLLIAGLLIVLYIGFRFSPRFAPGAVVALVHDIGITAGLFVIFGLEFDLRVLAALLAILGYSLNDTIIIYDRIRENMALRTKFDLVDVLNRSVNQTLARTVLTSGTTLLVILALLVLGGEVIRPFSIAMAIGVLVGTYSSIFIAAPTLLLLENAFRTSEPPSTGQGRSESRAEGGSEERPQRRRAQGQTKSSRRKKGGSKAARAK